MILRHLLLLLVTVLGWAAPAQAQVRPRENAIAVSLLPAGSTLPKETAVPLAIVMRPKPGWHGYWKNPGDAGAEARVEWDLPPGVTVGPLRYPVPDRLMIAGLMNYVFERDYALLADLRIPRSIPAGTRLPIRAKLDYLACTDEICVPESTTIATEIRVAGGVVPLENGADMLKFERALPYALPGEGEFKVDGDRLRIAIPMHGRSLQGELYLYPATARAIDHAAPQTFWRRGDLLIVETEAAEDAARLQSFDGLLEVGNGKGLAFTAQRGPVPSSGRPVAAAEPEPSAVPVPLAAALLGAFIGGLLLNVMPCVFPILSLKALSLARAGANEAAARREALAYSAGAVLVCLALGALLLALRAGGETVGWAFQLQDPRVILFLLLLVTAITLNLAGLFELPTLGAGGSLAGSGGARGAFWTGGLAAFIATPCTGPFMGAALGAALILPTLSALAVFGGLGIGLALPFLLLGFVPALRRRLPRPGPWMRKFRHILAIPMALTGLGLAWVLARQTGTDGLALGIAAAFALGLCLAWWGRRGGRVALAPAALAALAGVLLIPTAIDPAAARPKSDLPSEPFSEARLAELRAEGRPVFVYFTADWCLTCKVNERGVLGREEVARSFAAGKVAVLAGDWTRGDAEIGRFLEKQGRSGVPLYLYYAPGRPGEILPQILTAGRLTGLAG